PPKEGAARPRSRRERRRTGVASVVYSCAGLLADRKADFSEKGNANSPRRRWLGTTGVFFEGEWGRRRHRRNAWAPRRGVVVPFFPSKKISVGAPVPSCHLFSLLSV